MNTINILQVKLTEQYGLDILVSPLIWIVLLLLLFFAWGIKRYFQKKTWEPVEVNIPIGNIGKVTIRPNHEIIRIAHQAWTELITRKAGLMFDENHDVIVEVYNSWYELFREFRNLTKSIPAEKIREHEDAKRLVDILVRALNEGLRPHLTQWQAKFRRWYSAEANKHPEKTPQEIQQLYPDYKLLVDDLKKVNQQMVEFAEALRKIGHGKSKA
jgi:hypothetical protein